MTTWSCRSSLSRLIRRSQTGHQGSQEHGQQGHRHNAGIHFLADASGSQAHTAQDKRELTGLEHGQAQGQGHHIAVPEGPGQRSEDEALDQADHHYNAHDQQQVFLQIARIQQHAHRGEKQQSENIAQGDDVAQGLVVVFRFAEYDARHKGSKGEREADLVGGEADAQPQGRYGEQEEFPAVRAADQDHHSGDDPGSHQNHQAEEYSRSQEGPAKVRQARLQVGERGQQDQHGHQGQVLHQKNADHHAAGQRSQATLGLESFQDDHGAG